MVKVLVTGGAGFVGSHVVDTLVEEGLDVVVADVLLAAAHDGRPDHLNPAARYLEVDLRDTQRVESCLEGVSAVSHQASMVGLGVDFDDATAYVGHNDLGTAALLQAMHRVGFDGRLVLASSMVVYGEGRYCCVVHGMVRPGPRTVERLEAGAFEPACPTCERDLLPEPVPEDAPPDPRNLYAATKLHQEHLCALYAREHDTDFVALRYHNVYGPRMPRDTPYAGVASIFRSALAAGRRPQVFEDGRQRRDFVHVTDVARANLLALADEDAVGAYNIASGEPHTVGEMATVLAEAAGGPAPEITGGYRLGDVRHVFASTDRAERELGFRARTRFADGFARFATDPLRRGRALP